MSANVSNKSANEPAAGVPAVPKRITNAQTVCNQKNEKGKLCNGHLKQLRTAGEASEVHLRGDDVLSKCQTCGTLYMGPPLGHVRDPNKQTRFVEAELTALLQAAGGTLPMIKKNEQGMFVIVEPEGQQGAAKPAAVAKPAANAAKPSAPAAPKHKVGGQPNRQLFKRSSYAGIADTGPVPGETFEQKVERLRKVSAAAKQRTEEGGGVPAPETFRDSSPDADLHRPAAEAQAATGSASAAPLSAAAATASPVAGAETPADLAPDSIPPATAHKATGQADRTLMKRSTYCGVADTGPAPGESFEEKVARLTKVSAAVKQRADEGGQ
ncbi:MAG: hypothetical protein M3R68_02425 [Acidobacteriota bacterium]|nr:hypothetical protein [Acidobacteriota bacterium]